jgi:hypothetical protein
MIMFALMSYILLLCYMFHVVVSFVLCVLLIKEKNHHCIMHSDNVQASQPTWPVCDLCSQSGYHLYEGVKNVIRKI